MPVILPHILAFIIGTVLAVAGGVVLVMNSPELWGLSWRFCIVALVVGGFTMGVAISNLRGILRGQ